MRKHTKIYFNHFGYDQHSHIQCEVPGCGAKAVDIHHVIYRSYFGKKTKHLQDDISNLVALCRSCHCAAHDNKISKEKLLEIVGNRK